MGYLLKDLDAYSRPRYHPNFLTPRSAFGTLDSVERLVSAGFEIGKAVCSSLARRDIGNLWYGGGVRSLEGLELVEDSPIHLHIVSVNRLRSQFAVLTPGRLNVLMQLRGSCIGTPPIVGSGRSI